MWTKKNRSPYFSYVYLTDSLSDMTLVYWHKRQTCDFLLSGVDIPIGPKLPVDLYQAATASVEKREAAARLRQIERAHQELANLSNIVGQMVSAKKAEA